MTKFALALGLTLMLIVSGCGEDEPAVTEDTPREPESPTPTPIGTFQLQGRIVETLGSTSDPAAAASPTPTGTPTATPTGAAQPTPTERAEIERAAPGSMSIRLTSYSGEATSCIFEQGDTVVVAFTRATNFTPTELTANERFPRNLRETNVNVQGKVVDEENCVLSADSVAPQTQGQTSPTAGATAGQTPTPTGSPSPTE